MTFVDEIAVKPDGGFSFEDDSLGVVNFGGEFEVFEVAGANNAVFGGNLNTEVLVGKSVLGLVRDEDEVDGIHELR